MTTKKGSTFGGKKCTLSKKILATPTYSPRSYKAKVAVTKVFFFSSGVTKIGVTRGRQLMVSPLFSPKKTDDPFSVITLFFSCRLLTMGARAFPGRRKKMGA